MFPMFNLLLDLLFPKRSLTGSEGTWMTNDEMNRLRLSPIRLHKDLLKKKGMTSVDCLVAAGSERDSPLLKKAIRTFKYGRIPALGPLLGKHLAEAVQWSFNFTPLTSALRNATPRPIKRGRKR